VEEDYKNRVEILHVTYDRKENAFYPCKVYRYFLKQSIKLESRIFFAAILFSATFKNKVMKKLY